MTAPLLVLIAAIIGLVLLPLAFVAVVRLMQRV